MITETMRQYVFDACQGGNNAFGPAFFEEHLLVVREYSGWLAQSLGAEAEIVELAAYLHDISAVEDFAALPKHPVLSAEIVRTVLRDHGYPVERIERVAKCILSHSTPVQMGNGSLEEVCLSHADAMSQIVKPIYWLYYVFRVRQFGFAEGRDWLRQRVKSNWAALIPPARALIQEEYGRVSEFLRL